MQQFSRYYNDDLCVVVREHVPVVFSMNGVGISEVTLYCNGNPIDTIYTNPAADNQSLPFISGEPLHLELIGPWWEVEIAFKNARNIAGIILNIHTVDAVPINYGTIHKTKYMMWSRDKLITQTLVYCDGSMIPTPRR